MLVDPASSTASTIDIRSLGTGNGKWGFGAVLGGAVVVKIPGKVGRWVKSAMKMEVFLDLGWFP